MGHLSGPHDDYIIVQGGSVTLEFPKNIKKSFFESLCYGSAVYKERDRGAQIERIEVFLPDPCDSSVKHNSLKGGTRHVFEPENGKCRIIIKYHVSGKKRFFTWLLSKLGFRRPRPYELAETEVENEAVAHAGHN